MANTFNGQDIFGPVAIVNVVPNPNAVVLHEYPGVNGMDATNLGSRGAKIMIEGEIVAANVAALFAIETILYNHQKNATIATFHDDVSGTDFTKSYIEQFQPTGRINPTADGTGVMKSYQCLIRSLG